LGTVFFYFFSAFIIFGWRALIFYTRTSTQSHPINYATQPTIPGLSLSPKVMGMYISKLVLSSLPFPRRLALLPAAPLPPSSSSSSSRMDDIFTLEEGAPCIDFSPPPPPPPPASPLLSSSSCIPTSTYQDFHTIQNQYHKVIVKEPQSSLHSGSRYQQHTQQQYTQQQEQQQQQPFLIENCVNCDIYILETTASVVVANCSDCRIVLGPSEGTVLIRDSARCALVAACHQFRTRGCVDLDIWLFSVMPPMIETTIQARFGCYTYAYTALKTQFQKAGLWPFVGQNACWQVYDLTPQFTHPQQQQQQAPIATTKTTIPETDAASPHTHTHTHTHFTFMSQQTLLACSHAAGVRPLPYEFALRVGYSEEPIDRVVPFTTATTAAATAAGGGVGGGGGVYVSSSSGLVGVPLGGR
jgi:hypothetical protein